MLSRVADSVFWLGRYAERAENYARFIVVNYNLALDLPPGIKEQWRPVIAATGDESLFNEKYSEANRENALKFLAFDRENANSIISTVHFARENARQIRESISNEIWEVLNELYHYMNASEKKKIWKKDSPDPYVKIRRTIQLMQGIIEDTAPRVEGWYFNKIGQFLERADKTSRILDVKYHMLLPSVNAVGTPLDFLHWNALLKSVGAFNTYRQIYGKLDNSNIVKYLILNAYFPRSILFCLIQAEECLRELSETKRGYSNDAEKLIGALRSELEFCDVEEIFKVGLHEYLDNLQLRMNKISEAIYDQYFRIRSNFAQLNEQQ